MATYFDVLGVPRVLDLDGTTLDRRFRELSLELHPDRQTGADARERRQAMERTTTLNEAYRTLKDPARRAFYLLKLHGVDLDREDAAAQREMPLEFLEEVMERREALEVVRRRKDLDAALAMAREVEQARRAALARAESALAAVESGTGDAKSIERATHALGQVRYFTRFLEEVAVMEEELSA